jgi:hypothetical protein
MISRKEHADVSIDAGIFANFNSKLFFDENIEKDSFELPNSSAELLITPDELGNVLQTHFKANKSTGLSLMPL